jgi:hypothetical protein
MHLATEKDWRGVRLQITARKEWATRGDTDGKNVGEDGGGSEVAARPRAIEMRFVSEGRGGCRWLGGEIEGVGGWAKRIRVVSRRSVGRNSVPFFVSGCSSSFQLCLPCHTL